MASRPKHPAAVARKMAFLTLRASPWLVFGPITGLMTERAIRCHKNGDRLLAVLYVVANICVLAAIPALTVAVLRWT